MHIFIRSIFIIIQHQIWFSQRSEKVKNPNSSQIPLFQHLLIVGIRATEIIKMMKTKQMVNGCQKKGKKDVNPKVVSQIIKSQVLSWVSSNHRLFHAELSAVEAVITRQSWSTLSVSGWAWAMGWPGSLEFKYKSYIGATAVPPLLLSPITTNAP